MKNRTMKRIGAAAALVTVLGVISAFAEVSDTRLYRGLQPPPVTSNDDAALISWLSTSTLPMLDNGRAVMNTSPNVEVMPPMVVHGSMAQAS